MRSSNHAHNSEVFYNHGPDYKHVVSTHNHHELWVVVKNVYQHDLIGSITQEIVFGAWLVRKYEKLCSLDVYVAPRDD